MKKHQIKTSDSDLDSDAEDSDSDLDWDAEDSDSDLHLDDADSSLGLGLRKCGFNYNTVNQWFVIKLFSDKYFV